MSLCQPVIGSMAAILRDSVVVVVVVRTRPRAIPLAMITTRKSTHGFSFVSHIRDAYGAPLGGPSAGGPLRRSSAMNAGVIFISDSMYSRNNVDSFNIAKKQGDNRLKSLDAFCCSLCCSKVFKESHCRKERFKYT